LLFLFKFILFDVLESELEPNMFAGNPIVPLLEVPEPLTEPLGRGGQLEKGSMSSKLEVGDAPAFDCFSASPN
jgi:hypothetical protein